MVRTEREAQRLWCPFARTYRGTDEGPVTVNREGPGTVTDATLCIGSGCMAWRKRVSREHRDQRPRDEEAIGVHEAGGYCGLAGRPE